LQLVEQIWTRPKNTRSPENTSKQFTHKDTHTEIQETESVARNSDYCEAEEEERGEMENVRKRSADLPFLRRRRRRADRVSRAVSSGISLPPSFPYRYLPSFHNHGCDQSKNCYRRLRFYHFHKHAAFLPVCLATEIKGNRENKLYYFLFADKVWFYWFIDCNDQWECRWRISESNSTNRIKSRPIVGKQKIYPFTSFLSFFLYCSDLSFFGGDMPESLRAEKNFKNAHGLLLSESIKISSDSRNPGLTTSDGSDWDVRKSTASGSALDRKSRCPYLCEAD
jgi:hypothetical protein